MKTVDFLVKAIFKGKEYRRMVRYKYEEIEMVQECIEMKLNIKFKNGDTKTIDVERFQIIAKGELNDLVYASELIGLSEDELREIEAVSENFVFNNPDNLAYVIADEKTVSILKSSLKYL